MTRSLNYMERRALDKELELNEKNRRRERTEQGRSPAQHTTRSVNKARRAKYPGKGHRQSWRGEL